MEERFKSEEAQNYDEVIRRRVPLYAEIQSLMVSLIPLSKKEYIRVLDLGCGTGGTSVSLLKEFPLARVTGIDSSPAMLEVSSGKVKQTTWRIDFLCQDLKDPLPQCEDGFDAILSAFSLHYLNEGEKKELFARCLTALKPGGIFIDAEAVLSPSEKVYQAYLEKWKEFQRSNGFSDEEIGTHMLKFIRDVKPVTVERQVELMAEVGFTDVECYFKYLNWAVFGGSKLASETAQTLRCRPSHPSIQLT